MRLTFDWLKTHLDTTATLEEITDRLAMLGLPVEELVDRAAEFANFTVGHVVDARPHPNADRLKICTVDTGTGTIDVVCGAPNARTGMKGVFAPVGARLPGNGMLLKKARIRGV